MGIRLHLIKLTHIIQVTYDEGQRILISGIALCPLIISSLDKAFREVFRVLIVFPGNIIDYLIQSVPLCSWDKMKLMPVRSFSLEIDDISPFSPKTTAGLSDPTLIFAVDKGDTFIGYVIFHDFDELSMEIGWVLRPSEWGKGYASCLTEILIEKASNFHKQSVIECSPEQAITKHLALKHGFDYEGRKDGLDVYRLKR